MSASSLQTYGRSFALAARLLPARLHADVADVYQLCRLVDDLADEHADRAGLAAVRAEVAGAPPRAGPAGAPRRPEVEAFLRVADRTGIPLGAAFDLIDGCASDIGPVRVRDDAELLRYAYRVAGTVGLMMCAVFGARRGEGSSPASAAQAHAIDLGVAMQLTNIARDVAEDAARDRGVPPFDLAGGGRGVRRGSACRPGPA